MWVKLVALSALVLASISADADVPRVAVVDIDAPRPRMNLLTPGVRRYVRYSVNGGIRSTIDIWTRTVSYEMQDPVRRLRIRQRWDCVVPPASTLDQDAWFDARTFAPITYVRRAVVDGATTTGGYRFGLGEVTGMGELEGNARRDFRIAASEQPFNVEYDTELLQTLPWRRGYVADIVFFDPGKEPPAHYLFREAGEVKLRLADGRYAACWQVTADYNTGRVVSRFWVDRRTQLVLHEESERDGTTYVETLLAAESADQG